MGGMITLRHLLLGIALLPAIATADNLGTSCVEALEQRAALMAQAPVYKLVAGRERRYIEDSDRRKEIARFDNIIDARCSADATTRRREELEAQHLHVARSPKCAMERDKLFAMEKLDSREPEDLIAVQRDFVVRNCPLVETSDVWLVQLRVLHR
jgi:hypothetical protein